MASRCEVNYGGMVGIKELNQTTDFSFTVALAMSEGNKRLSKANNN